MQKKNVEAIYPLSPSQQGMLFETLYAHEAGIHIEQSLWQLSGHLDVEAFANAWQRIVDRHAALRTCFVWENQPEPLQVVLREAQLTLETEDWRGALPEQQQAQLDAYIQTIRARGFTLARPPLMQVALLRTAETTYQFVWTTHHIVMDGWCLPLLVKEVLNYYETLHKGWEVVLEPSRPYGEYLAWLKRQDLQRAEEFWRAILCGMTAPTPLGIEIAPPSGSDATLGYTEQTTRVPTTTTKAIQDLALQHRVTLSSVVQGVWGMLLGRYSRQQEILFGATVSGRPADLPGVETMIGFFINTVPIRFNLLPNLSFWEWLQSLQPRQFEQQAYEYCSTGQIHQWSEIPGTLALYESILVVENYPVDLAELSASRCSIVLQSFHAIGAHTKYPLTILATPGAELEIKLIANRQRFDPTDVQRMLTHFVTMFQEIVTATDLSLNRLMHTIPFDQIPKVVTPPRFAARQPAHERDAGEGQTLVLPRTPTEIRLAAIWADVLKLPQIGIYDNFFELGGHSLVALNLMAQIQQQFGKRLPLTTLFQAPTIAQFAQLLEQQSPIATFTPLVKIQQHGEKLPFFCVHSMDGGVFYYEELARQIGMQQPFYGLQASGLEPGTPVLPRFEEMAAQYVDAIRTVAPHGPYLIGGYSYGGLIAYELVQQLRAAGEQVNLLVLIDNTTGDVYRPTPATYQGSFGPEEYPWILFMDMLNRFFNVNLFSLYCTIRGIQFDQIATDLHELSHEAKIRAIWESIQHTGIIAPYADVGYLERVIHIMNVTMHAAQSYNVQPYHGRVVLFRSLNDMVLKMDDPTFGWGPYISPPIELCDIPGDHFSIMKKPFISILAQKLAVYLEQVQTT